MNIRFYNANILSMKDDVDIIFGEVWVCDNTIIHVGDYQQTNIAWDKEYNLNGNLIMPGLKNCHTHSAMSFLRSFADDLPLDEWLHKKVFPMEGKLTADDICLFSKISILEYLTSGVTTNFDMYINTDALIQASEEMNFRTVACGAINNYVQSVEYMEDCYRKYNGNNELISYIIGCHAEYTTSEEILQDVSSLANKYQAPVYMHLSETRKEVDECVNRYGTTPVEFLDRMGMFNYGGGGFHCVHMSAGDIDVFVKRGLNAITCPASNLKLASGIAPISALNKENINIAIGTDGPASNNALDMFREMYLVTALAKLKDNDAASTDADQVLRMATINGAKALGLYDCDIIERGKIADLTVLDMNRPNMQPVNKMGKNVIYSGSKDNVVLTMVNGKVLYEKGQFDVGIEPEELYYMANKRLNEMNKEF